MLLRTLFSAALVAAVVCAPDVQSQQPKRSPLQEAADILSATPGAGTAGLSVGYLSEQVAKPKEPEKKLCYICWYGDFATYGGATREEAIADAKKAKQLNPNTSIRVTEHLALPTMSIDAISKTPGKVILNLP
jgi:hypothetical protein